MVSIKYFWGVGAFCRMKSIPRGNFTSSKDVPTALAAAISTIARIMSDNRLSIPQVPGISCLHVSHTTVLPDDSEEKLERKLNQARVRPRGRTGYDPEVGVIRLAAGRVRRSELRAIE